MRKLNKQALWYLLGLCEPAVQYVVVGVLDQTIGFVDEDGGYTTVHREARMFPTHAAAQAEVDAGDRRADAFMRSEEGRQHAIEHGLQKFTEKQLALPFDQRHGHDWVEEVRNPEIWRHQRDTW